MKGRKTILFAVLLLVGLGLLSFTYSGSRYFEIAKNLEIFNNLYKEINTYYVDDVDPGKIMRSGVDAMLQTLDPYTNYISESQVEQYRFMSEGRYHGIGTLIDNVNGIFVITEPHEGSPAYESGLRAGDILLEVDGQSLEGKNMDELSMFLRGAPNTTVRLKVKSPGQIETKELDVVRSDIEVQNVPHFALVENEYAYVNLTIFSANASRNIANALRDLRKENPNYKGVILDLRGNGGGLLREAVDISNLFLDKGIEVVTTKGKVKDWDQSFLTTKNAMDEEIPVVVLVNNQSASASEIVSGVMQDLDRGILIGQRTYGKGLVQNTKEIGYNSRVKITTAKYYIPSGRCIQSVSYKDGEPLDIPDSLRTTFKTKGGRPVLDGGGVTPDIVMEPVRYNPFVDFLLKEYIIFDYVTQWVLKNDSISNPEVFKFEQFDEFVKHVQKLNLTYESESEKMLSEIKEKLAFEMGKDAPTSEIKSLEKKLQRNFNTELERNKNQITEAIERDIVTRYYFQKGKIKYNLKADPEVKEAVKVLSNTSRYNKLLKTK